jgi:hypothetical protein
MLRNMNAAIAILSALGVGVAINGSPAPRRRTRRYGKSCYMPHQGRQEKARRVRQMEARR